MYVDFVAKYNTYMTAFPSDLGSLEDDEKVSVAKNASLRARAISQKDGFLLVELESGLSHNWRKRWYLEDKDWLAPTKPIGFVEEYSEAQISGWAYEVGAPGRYVELNIYLNGNLIGTAAANLPRPDVLKAGHESGNCGFVFPLPSGALNANNHLEIRTIAGSLIGYYPQ